MHIIYALKDPCTGEVRYIGATSAPLPRRLAQHMYGANRKDQNSPKVRWLRELSALGLRPVIERIDMVLSDSPIATCRLEQSWMNFYESSGADILNVRRGRRDTNPIELTRPRGGPRPLDIAPTGAHPCESTG